MIYQLLIVLAAILVLQKVFLQVINSEVRQDYRDILKDGSKDSLGRTYHRQSFLRIAALGAAMVIPFVYVSWHVALALLFMEGAEFWLLFDRRLNVSRGLDKDYVGKSAGLDKLYLRLFAKAPGRAMMWTKIACLAVGACALLYSLWAYSQGTNP